MKLVNKTFQYHSIALLIIIAIWSAMFYFFMIEVIHDSIDEELENHKRLILLEIDKNEALLEVDSLGIHNFQISKVENKEEALNFKNTYTDTLLYLQDDDDPQLELEPVRMLITMIEHNNQYYKIMIINSMIEESDLIKNLFYAILILYILLVVSISLLNRVVLERLWNPFYIFLSQLKNYRIGTDIRPPSMHSTIKEFNDLDNAVNTLINRTIASFDQQKQFISNASHELQTPLAIMLTKLEILLDSGNLTEVQAQQVASVLGIVERMIKLNKSLLLLTKIENNQILNNQILSVNDIITQTVEDLEETALYKQVHVTTELTEILQIHIDPTLARILIGNLLRNAIFHNEKHGTVLVTIKNACLYISNTGVKHPLDVSKIFTRFYKTYNSTEGTGLGLALVNAVATLYLLRVEYDFSKDKHVFSIDFSALK